MSHVDDSRIEAWLDRDRSGMSAAESTEIGRHLDACAACAARMEAARSVRIRADQILGSTRLADAGLPDFESIRARASGASVIVPRRSHPVRRRLVAVAWAASVFGAIGLGWVTRDLVAPRPLAFGGSAGRSSEAVLSAPTADEQVPESASTARDLPAYVATGTGGGVSGEVGSVAPEQTESVAAASVSSSDATANSGRGSAQLVAQTAPTVARAGSMAMSAADPARPSNDRPPVPVATEAGPIPSLDGPPALGYSRQAFSLADGGRDTLAGIPSMPGVVVLEGIVVAGREPNNGAERSGGDVPPSVEAVAGSPALLFAASAAGAEAVFAPSVAEGSRNPVWPGMPIDIREGARRLGVPLITIPDMEIISVDLVNTAGGPIVHLRQRVPDRGTLLLVQRIGPTAALPPIPAAMATIEVRRGPLFVTAVAPLSPDELGELLSSARQW